MILKALSDGNEWSEQALLSHIKRERWIYRPLHMTLLGQIVHPRQSRKVILVGGKYRSATATPANAIRQNLPRSNVCRVFVSYRRRDSALVTVRIRDRLARHIGAESVFMDVDSIPLGKDFRVAITVLAFAGHN